MHWSEDNQLHSDMALQEAEATGDLFLGLYQEEDQFSYMRITNKDHGEEDEGRLRTEDSVLYPSLCICVVLLLLKKNWLCLDNVCWMASFPDIALNWINPKLISAALIHVGILF